MDEDKIIHAEINKVRAIVVLAIGLACLAAAALMQNGVL
jgi:hypothetical protein